MTRSCSRSIFVNFDGSSSRAAANGASADEQEALVAFLDEDAALDQLVLGADDVVGGVLFARQLR